MFLINPYIYSSTSTDFIMTVDTTQSGSASDTFILPAGNIGTYNASVDWGDGTTSTITAWNDADLTHVYSTGGIYTVKISGDFPYINFNNGGDKLKLMSINNWGVNQWRSMQAAFMGCTNLEVYATDVPDFSLCTTFYRAFNICSSLTTLENINQWDMSAATTLKSMFDRTGLTGHLDLSGWQLLSCADLGTGGSFRFMYQTNITSLDVSNWNFRPSGTQFNNFIIDCDSLTTITGINTWQNTDRITNMTSFVSECALISSLDFSGMDFSGCGSFERFTYANPSLTNINLTGVTLKTTGTISMYLAFSQCTSLTSISGIESFNSSAVSSLDSTFKNSGLTGDLDLTSWNVSNVTTMNACFMQLSGLNSVNISGWDLSSCTTWGTGQFSSCFYGTPISSIDVSNITLRPTGVNCTYTFTNMGTANVIGLDTWDVSRITSLNLFMSGAKITTTEYDKLLIAWDALDPVDGLSAHFGTSQYTSGGAAETARSGLISTDSWTITDGGSV